MRSIESEGDTIDDAIENALRALAVDRERVEIEILADASRGLLGFGGKKARVRATVRAPLAGLSGSTPVPQETVGRLPASPGGALARSTETIRKLPPELVAKCESIARELFALMGVEARVSARMGAEPGQVVVDVSGDEGGILIGRRGQTLDSLEYLLARIVSRGDDRVGRVVLDVEGYRQRRQQYLEALADRLADKVRKTGRVVTLNPMSPRDRRIVHLALANDGAVTTRSEGDGYYRRVLIVPAERPSGRQRQAGSPGSADV